MQAAADYNGSNSSTNVTSITTTAIDDMDSRGGGDSAAATLPMPVIANTVARTAAAAAASAPVTVTAAATSTTTPIAISPLLAEQQPATQNVLRNRLQLGKSTNNHNNFNASTATPYENGVQAQQRFDAAEYLGSNVEQMSVTPSPSPNVSPSKKASNVTSNNNAATNITSTAAITANTTTTSINVVSHINKIALEANASPPLTLNSSSSSSSSSASATNSNSNSTTSSVIATPILLRNGNANGGGGVGGGNGDKTSKEQLFLATKTISMPIKSASFSTFGEHLMNSTVNATKNSTTASSSSVTPTTLTPITNISANKKSTKSKKPEQGEEEEEQLLQWKDMPQYLQFNPYVLKGYRPLQTFKGCLFSLFYWHNETINILTHAIPIVYILAIVPGLMPWDGGYRFLSFCHVFGSVAPWCGSFVYHLFMNIETGENCYYRLLKLDMIGIWVSQSFGALPLVTATTFCFTHKWKWFFIITYCLMSLWGLYKALTASSPWQRRLCFALPFTMRSILTFLRTLGWVGGNAVALPHVYLQDVVSIFGGAIGAMRIPEKWFPGLVDFYLNSHNIMHVLVVLAVYSMHKATIKDFEWMSATNCNSFSNGTNETLETTLSANMEL